MGQNGNQAFDIGVIVLWDLERLSSVFSMAF